jgi:hypothetical protein
MEKKLDMLVKAMTSHSNAPIQQVTQVKVCAICSHIDHTTKTCPMFSIVDQESFLINLSQQYYEDEPSPIYWPSQYQEEKPSLIYEYCKKHIEAQSTNLEERTSDDDLSTWA